MSLRDRIEARKPAVHTGLGHRINVHPDQCRLCERDRNAVAWVRRLDKNAKILVG